MEARVRILNPADGQPAALRAINWTATGASNEVSSLTGTLEGAPLPLGTLMALETRSSSSADWVEPHKGRYVVTSVSTDQQGGSISHSFEAAELVAFLASKAVLRTTPEAEWDFDGPIGLMVTGPFLDAKGRSALKDITRNFASDHTSSGAAWAERAKLKWPTDETYLGMLTLLQEQAFLRWTSVGLELVIENGGPRGLVDVWLPARQLEKQRASTASLGQTASVIVTRDDSGTLREFHGPEYAGLGRMERAETVSGTSDTATVTSAATAALAAAAPRNSLSITYSFSQTGIHPGSLTLGDMVHVQDADGTWNTREITGWGIRYSDSSQEIDFSFGELPPDLALLIQKRGRMLGASISGNGRLAVSSTSTEGMVEAWNGHIADNYPGDGRAPVVIKDSTGEAFGPLPFINGSGLKAGAPVQVVGSIVQGIRVVETDYPAAGITVPLQPVEGWSAYAEWMYGIPALTLFADGTVVAQGAIVPTPGVSTPATAFVIEEASFRPLVSIRTGPTNSSAWSIATSGVMSSPSTSSGSINVLTGLAWNVGQNRVLTHSFAWAGIAVDGLVWFNGFKTSAGSAAVALSAPVQPDAASNYRGWPLTATTYTVPAGSPTVPAVAGGRFWRPAGASVAWQTVPTIPSANVIGSLKALKTSDGWVMLSWDSSSSTLNSAATRPVAILPEHLRPRWLVAQDSVKVNQRGEVYVEGNTPGAAVFYLAR